MAVDEKETEKASTEKAIEKKEPEVQEETTNSAPCLDDDTQLSEIIDKAPPEYRPILKEAFGMMVRSVGPAPHPLFSKFDNSNINTYLENVRLDDERQYKLASSNRWFYILVIIIFLVALGLAIFYLAKSDRDLLITLIQIFVVLAGGVGAGYGIAKRDK